MLIVSHHLGAAPIRRRHLAAVLIVREVAADPSVDIGSQ
jgi:hypothetical protein